MIDGLDDIATQPRYRPHLGQERYGQSCTGKTSFTHTVTLRPPTSESPLFCNATKLKVQEQHGTKQKTSVMPPNGVEPVTSALLVPRSTN